MAIKLMALVWSVTALTAAGQQRPVPPAFARPAQGRAATAAAVAALDLEPDRPVPQPFRRVSVPLYRGRGFSLDGQEPRPSSPAALAQQQQAFRPRPIADDGGLGRAAENDNADDGGADAPQQPVRQPLQPQQVDRVQQQPEKQFPSFRPQPQIQPIETQPHFIKKVVQRPLKRVQVTEDSTTSKSVETIQKLKQERTESAGKQRAKKPVSQVLRRYRDDNPDGSITWGFENDDGTFKEETIGADCVTRGKYGYVDPEGVKREYSYQSGVPCDKDRRPLQEQRGQEQQRPDGPSAVQEAQASDSSYGYIDYAKSQYVMANGQTISLNGMAKNRARKPVARKAQAVGAE